MTEFVSNQHRETPREATEPLREDIRLLGGILGQIVREQAGDTVFDLVERARVESFRVRRSEIDRAELVSLFAGVSTADAIPVIRAFGCVTIILFVAVLAIAAGPSDDAFTSSPHATTYFVTPFSGLGVHVTSAAFPSNLAT